ncbi:MAG: PKD domain-containing protein, partial [Bacteroidetes bacterium]
AAFDAQGDQLIYELCAPLIGAGQDGLGGAPSTPNYECDDLLPNPACPPPYETVQYVPPFSALNPLGGDPPVTIDPVTGLLYGTPLAQGQYSVGVCVYEYRNGQLLSVIRRDFQFNVVNCQPLYVADLQADTQEDDHYFIEKCEDLEISFENKSIQQATLDEYRWEFLVDGQIQTFTEWSPTITFPHAGNFEGALLLNPGAPCGDTAYITVTIFPEIVPDFTFEYDTCSAGPVSYVNLSYIDGPGEFARQFWAFGDADTSNLTDPVHLFKDPGAYLTRLTVEDTHGCVADTAKWVNYLPAPSLLIVSPNDTISCPPAEVLFNNLSSPVDESYKVFWDFGDGTTGTELNPLHIYQSEGTYSVHLEIVSPLGCTIDTTFEDLIRIVPPPVADFRVDPPVVFGFNPVANFVDESIDAAHWEWYVNDQLIAHTQQVQNYMFRDTGLQKITLHITHPEKCQDTLTRWVDVVPEWTFYLPNAFTPNEDTNNDLFKGKGILTGIRDFDMQIWDRWGNQIFQTDDPLSGWNGRIHNTGRSAEEGVYLVRVTFTGPRGEPFEYQGVVTLFR